MSAVQPFNAWFFFAAEDATEVEVTYAKFGTDDEGYERWPSDEDLVHTVRVVAVEEDQFSEYVWAVDVGQIRRLPSWMVRDADIHKDINPELADLVLSGSA